MEVVANYANDKEFETAFVLQVSSSRELRLTKLSDDFRNGRSSYDLYGAINSAYPTALEQSKLFGAGHVHYDKLAEGLSGFGRHTGENARFYKLGTPTYSVDYQAALKRTDDALEAGQSPLFILSNKGFTVYGSEAKGKLRVIPNEKIDFYRYQQIKK